MKYLKQLMIIMLFAFAGELCNIFIPLPIPASVYGMILLLIALLAGVVKLPQIQETAGFMLEIMPIFFIGPTIRLLDEYQIIAGYMVQFIVICAVSTLAAFLCTGYTAQLIVKLKNKKEGKKDE